MLLAAVAGLFVAGCGGDPPPPVTTEAAPAVERLRIIFPEGLNVREMGDRVAAVRKIAIAKRGVTPKLTRARYLAAVSQARPPKPFLAGLEARLDGGVPLPGAVRVHPVHERRASSSPTS